MKKEIVPVGNNLPTIAITTDFLQDQTEFVAGGKVRSKSGGPNMVLIGFMPYNRMIREWRYEDTLTGEIFLTSGERRKLVKVDMPLYEADFAALLTQMQTNSCYLKISLDENNNYLFHQGLHGEGKSISESYKRFYCLCKYWSDKDEDHRHVLCLPTELELL
jgi:hypothetical protein